jgi:hypothetical protein
VVGSMKESMDTQVTSPAGTEVPADAPAQQQAHAATRPPEDAPAQQTPADAESPAGAEVPPEPRAPGFRERGRMRRRARFLRKTRELAYRDLGGLVFEMHRMNQRSDELVAAKLAVLDSLDRELRAVEAALESRDPFTVLREAGIAACPRCAAIHGSADRFCPVCGLPMSRHAERPIAAPPAGPPAASATSTLAGPPAPVTAPPAPAPAAAPPARTANPPAAAPRVADEDRPTEIIRPFGEGR